MGKTYTCPIIQSELSSFSLRSNMLEPLALFHRKILKGILNLSQYAATPAIHFLLGELPIEGKIHRDVFSLFYSVWRNPSSKIFSIIKYLLETSQNNSRTWAIHIKHLAAKYGLPHPLECLKSDPPLKSTFKEYIRTKICVFYERTLREKAQNNSSMKYLNMSLTGRRGRQHPSVSNIVTTQEVKKSRIHIKMLVGDYYTYDVKSSRSGGSPHCRACSDPTSKEDLVHILTQCMAYKKIRERIIPEYSEVLTSSESHLSMDEVLESNENLCQFILDASSTNLRNRINVNDPVLHTLFRISRNYCYAINCERTRIISKKEI